MNVNYTRAHHLCIGCKLCEDISPKGAISFKKKKGEYLPYVNISNCLGDKCGICTKICPGLGVNFNDNYPSSQKILNNKFIGNYVSLYTGYSSNYEIRYHSASGGMITGLLIHLLVKGVIDGAVVTKFSSTYPLTPEVFIARTKEDLISAQSSKY